MSGRVIHESLQILINLFPLSIGFPKLPTGKCSERVVVNARSSSASCYLHDTGRFSCSLPSRPPNSSSWPKSRKHSSGERTTGTGPLTGLLLNEFVFLHRSRTAPPVWLWGCHVMKTLVDHKLIRKLLHFMLPWRWLRQVMLIFYWQIKFTHILIWMVNIDISLCSMWIEYRILINI